MEELKIAIISWYTAEKKVIESAGPALWRLLLPEEPKGTNETGCGVVRNQ